MDIHFFTTAVQGSNVFNNVADFCLSPVLLVYGKEHTYRIIKDENGKIVNTLVDQVALRNYSVIKILFAVVFGGMGVLVVVGLALKCVALLCGSFSDYAEIKTASAWSLFDL